MHRFAVPVVAFGSLLLALGVTSASAQSNLNSMFRQLGERAIEEIIRPDPPQVTTPSTRTPQRQSPTAPAGPTPTQVMQAQQFLVRLGYAPGVPDGLMGPNTTRAISAFQRDAGIQQTGTVTDGLIAHLHAAAAGASDEGEHTIPQRVEVPSFDCTRASTPTEFVICGTPELARLDRRLAEAYSQALAATSDPVSIRAEQQAWLGIRNSCGGNAGCLRDEMTSRIVALGGRTAAQRAGFQAEPLPADDETGTGNDSLMLFDRAVYLLRFSNSGQRSDGSVNVVHYSTGNLDASEVETLTPAIADAIAARPLFSGTRAGAEDLAVGALTFEAYALVAGDWRNRVAYAIGSRYPDMDVSVIQIARAAGDGPEDGVADGPQWQPPAADFGPDEMPILRAWLPHYLENTSTDEQIDALERYIVSLQQGRDYSANAIFAENEIKDRLPEFLAREAYERWLAVLKAHTVEPPFDIRVRAEARNLEYDAESGDLVLYSGYDGRRRDYYESITHTILRSAIMETGVSPTVNYLRVEQPSWWWIGLDREIPTRFAMNAGHAEEMMRNRDVVVFDALLRVRQVDRREDERGDYAFVDIDVVGVNVVTDAGEQIAAFARDEMPRIAPPEAEVEDDAPVFETVHLARPRDILASVAARTGNDANALIESVYSSTSQDTFDKRDEIAELAASSQEIDLGGFWMSGYGRLADYDSDRGEYGLEHVVLTYPDSVSRNEKRIRRRDLLRLANVSEDSGVRFAMTEGEARRLRDTMKGSDATFRARLSTPVPGSANSLPELPLKAELVEIVFTSPGSDAAILDDENVVARVAPAPLPRARSSEESADKGDESAASVAMPDTYNMLGVRVGEPLATGFTQAMSEFGPESVLYGHRKIWVDAGISTRLDATAPLAESVILARDGNRDFLTIFHEPLLDDDPITGVARTITFAEGSRHTSDVIRQALVDKYGKIGSENSSVYLWSHTRQVPEKVPHGEMSMGELIALSTEQQNQKTQNFVCGKKLESIATVLDYRLQSSTRNGYPVFDTIYPLVDEAGDPAPYPAARPLWAIDVHIMDEKCDTDMVLAVNHNDTAGLVAELRVLVTSRAYLAMIEADAEAALREHEAAEQEAPEIDF